MTRSVRRALVDWLQSIVDHLPKDLVENLGGRQVHANARYDVRDRLVVGIEDTGRHGDVDVPVEVPQLREEVHELARPAVVANNPGLLANQDVATAFNNNIFNHRQASLKNLFNMNSPQQGASYNRDVERLNRLQGAVLGNFPRKESSGGDK